MQVAMEADYPWLVAILETSLKVYCDRLNGFSWTSQASELAFTPFSLCSLIKRPAFLRGCECETIVHPATQQQESIEIVILRRALDPESAICGVQGDDKELLEACQTRLAVMLANVMGCCHNRVGPSSMPTANTQLVALLLCSLCMSQYSQGRITITMLLCMVLPSCKCSAAVAES